MLNKRILIVLLTMLMLGCVFGPSTAGASAFSWTYSTLNEEPVFAGLSCPSVSLCVATEQAGNILTSTDPTGGASAWKVTHVDSYPYLESISCPSVSFCAAVDAKSNVLTSTNPTGGASAWKVTKEVDTVPPFEETVALHGISCPSASLCVSADELGDILISTNPTSGPWSIFKVDNTSNEPSVQRVTCPSVSFCAATDAFGSVLTSTNPTGGAGAWKVTTLSEFYISGLTCQSATLCIAGNVEEEMLTSTNPTGGAGAWIATNVGSSSIASVSCPLASLCVATDAGGNVLTSTNPTGGAGAWAVTNVSFLALYSLTCPSTSLCLAVADLGRIYVGKAGEVPVNANLPIISGPAEVGVTLFCGEGSWTGSPESYTYQWERNEVVIGGAVSQTYLLTAADEGYNLSCTVTAHNTAGASTPATSAPTGEVQGAVITPPPPEEKKVIPLEPKPEESKPVQCLVPKLKGKTLSQAKRLLTQSHCKLGKVTSTKTGGKLKVVSQKPGPGKTLSTGSKVAIKLG